jgi:hypothetical protein
MCDLLFIGRHEAMPGLKAILDLGVVNEEEEGALARLWIALLRHSVPRASNLCRLSNSLDCRCGCSTSLGGLISVTSRAASDIGLVPLALSEADTFVPSCE